MKKKSVFLIAFSFCCFSIFCGSVGGVSWMEDPYYGLSSEEYIAAIGSGKTSTDADHNAALEIASILSQDIEAVSTLEQKATNTDEESSYLTNIQTTSALKDISGLSITDRTTTKDGRFFSRAVLNKADAARNYSLLFNENESKINSLISLADKKSASFEKCTMLVNAYKLALENDEYKALLSILRTSVRKIPLYENSSAVMQKAQSAFEEISVQVKVNGDSTGRLAAAFASAIHQTGISTNTNKEDSPYILLCDASFVNDGVKEETVFIRYNLDVRLVIRESGKEILSFSINARKGKLTEHDAMQTALRDAESKIKEDFSQKFLTMFESPVN